MLESSSISTCTSSCLVLRYVDQEARPLRRAERVVAVVLPVDVDDDRVAPRRDAVLVEARRPRRSWCSAARCRRRRRRARPRDARSSRGCRRPRARSRCASGRAYRSRRRRARGGRRRRRGACRSRAAGAVVCGGSSAAVGFSGEGLMPPSARSMCAIGGAGGPASIAAAGEARRTAARGLRARRRRDCPPSRRRAPASLAAGFGFARLPCSGGCADRAWARSPSQGRRASRPPPENVGPAQTPTTRMHAANHARQAPFSVRRGARCAATRRSAAERDEDAQPRA